MYTRRRGLTAALDKDSGGTSRKDGHGLSAATPVIELLRYANV